MQKKYLISLIGLIFAIPFVSVFASTPCAETLGMGSCDFDRTPSGLSIAPPISYSVNFTSTIVCPYSGGSNYWGLAYQNAENTAYVGYSEMIDISNCKHCLHA
jgi:hypothetical protein